MRYNRLEHFQNNPSNLAKFRLACRLLYDIGADHLLQEMNYRREPLPGHSENAIQENALMNQRAIGFAECLEYLFTLDTLGNTDEKPQAAPDFGAIDKMLADGRVSEEDAAMLRQMELDGNIMDEMV